jgi:hypothetical protein
MRNGRIGLAALTVVVIALAAYVMASAEQGADESAGPELPADESQSEAGIDGAAQRRESEDETSHPEQETVSPEEDERFLYSLDDILSYRSSMTKSGPYYNHGDAGHGGRYSPNDGQRSVALARQFLADPEASYWFQPDLPLSRGDPWASGLEYVRPMHAAWVYMTQPLNPDREDLRSEVKEFLLHTAEHPSHDYSQSDNYPVDFPGYAAPPIFPMAYWMARNVKMRDMLGRGSFDDDENDLLDRWFYDYANWSAHWIQNQGVGNLLPGRLERDYSSVLFEKDASFASYDGGPLIGSAGRAYNNRNAAVAGTMSLAANYLAYFDVSAPTGDGAEYGTYSVDELLDHSRLFVEETLRFSVWPQGFQGDFERGDRTEYPNVSAQTGWLYSANTLANVLAVAEYHALRGDMSVWDYGTTEGFDGSAGAPEDGGFREKNLHFFAWSISRYVNGGWGRTNDGEPLASPRFYHDVIPAALAHRFAPDDELLESAWKRAGGGFPEYPEEPYPQGTWPAQLGAGASMVGLIEHALASPVE